MSALSAEFVEAFDAFDPGITLQDISEYISTLEGITESACEIVKEIDTAAGGAVATVILATGYCTGVKLPVSFV